MKFNNKNIKLAIFDLDGTLVDSTSIWSDVDATFFKKRGQDIPPTYADEIAHVGLVAAAKLTKDKYFPNELEEDIIQEWHDLSLEAYATHIPLKNNVKRLLEKYYKLGIHIALATANSKELYEPCLTRLGIKQYFEFIIDVNSCKEGKDSPEIYDKVCTHFLVLRENTIIFEDSLTALKTAYNAGFNVIGVYDKNSTKDISEHIKYSHQFVDDFNELI